MNYNLLRVRSIGNLLILLSMVASQTVCWAVSGNKPIGNALQQVFKAVAHGHLKPNKHHRVLLPGQWRSASADGYAYITQKKELRIVLIPTWRGKGNNILGEIWCSRPLHSTDFHKDYYGNTCIALEVPDSDEQAQLVQDVIVKPTNVSEKYSVSYQLD